MVPRPVSRAAGEAVTASVGGSQLVKSRRPTRLPRVDGDVSSRWCWDYRVGRWPCRAKKGISRMERRRPIHSLPDRLARHGQIDRGQILRRRRRPVHDLDAVVHALYEGEAVPPIEAAFPGLTTMAGSTAASRGAWVSTTTRRLPGLRPSSIRWSLLLVVKIPCRSPGPRCRGGRARRAAIVRNRHRFPVRCRRGGLRRPRCSAGAL